MRIADREQGARDRRRIVHHRTLADPPIVDVAAEIAGRNRIDEVRLLRRQCDEPEMRSHRDAQVLKDAVLLLHEGVVDRYSGIIDGAMDYSERIRLRYPAVIVDRPRPIAVLCCIDLVDRNHLARLWL